MSTFKARFSDSQTGIKQAGQHRRNYELQRLSGLGSLLALSGRKQLGLTQGLLTKQQMSQASGAQQGAALGSLAQMAVLGSIL